MCSHNLEEPQVIFESKTGTLGQQWTLAFNHLPTNVNSVTQYAGQYVNSIWNINVHLRQAWMVKPTYCGVHGAGAPVTSDSWAEHFQLGSLLTLFGNYIFQSCSSSRFYKCNLSILLQGFDTQKNPLFCSLSFHTVYLGPYEITWHWPQCQIGFTLFPRACSHPEHDPRGKCDCLL